MELCCGSGFEALPVLDQLVEDGAVLDHRGAEFFGGCVNAVGANGDAMGEAIVFHDARVVNRDIVSALVEARTWISASLKERIDKVVGIGDGYELIPPINIPSTATNISIANDGTIQYTAAGGKSVTAGPIKLSQFVNPQGLSLEGGSIYTETVASGPPKPIARR